MFTRDRILRFIHRFIEEQGFPPTIREIGKGVGLKSTKAVKVHLDRLQTLGLIKKTPNQARGISVEPFSLPIVGRVQAGLPNLSLEDVEGLIYPHRWKGCFLIRVKGDSMDGIGILDGDMVLVKPARTGHSGDIVVALIDGEATVKRLVKKGKVWYLRPENPNYRKIRFDGQVVGKVIGIIRLYS